MAQDEKKAYEPLVITMEEYDAREQQHKHEMAVKLHNQQVRDRELASRYIAEQIERTQYIKAVLVWGLAVAVVLGIIVGGILVGTKNWPGMGKTPNPSLVTCVQAGGTWVEGKGETGDLCLIDKNAKKS